MVLFNIKESIPIYWLALENSKHHRFGPAKMASQSDDVSMTAECLCKTHKFTTTVPRTALPLKATTCHCDSCRRFTGALYSIDAPWSGDPATIRASTLARYDFSQNLKILFCGTCSAPLFWESPRRDASTGAAVGRKFTVFVGALSNDAPTGLVEVGCHMFVGDTRDGGASMWMRWMNGGGAPPVKRFAEMKYESEELAEDWPGAGMAGAAEDGEKEEIPIRCHCGGVDLVFLRAQAEREFTANRADELPRVVDPVSRKYVAGFDACNSCRSSFGSDFFNWAFVFLRHIGYPSGRDLGEESGGGSPGFPQTLQDLHAAVSSSQELKASSRQTDPRLGTLAVYRSSEGVKRYFCSRCSACVFYAADGKHRDMVDVAIGVLRADEGARAERSFKWLLGGPLQHRDDIAGGWRATWLKAVEAEAEAWRKERGFPEWWRHVKK